ncbi:DUF896 domain-containing protein [Oenococcus alcoholitolerans]|uniref:DUF896 domain-containing protein n=1 Tax=Oenococcus alcoholitolerans TaxID=931074 RepID=UPI003F72BE79
MVDNSHSEEEHEEPKFVVDENEQAENQALRSRINELAKKQRSPQGLTKEEQQEQQKLRKRFLTNFRRAFRSQVEMMRIFDDNGNEVTPKKVVDIQKKKGLRD